MKSIHNPSIFEFIRAHIVDGRPGLSENGYTLPDEDRLNHGSALRWAAGALDGVTTHHMSAGQDQETAARS